MAALINALVTWCIDPSSSSPPFHLLGLLQESAALQESLHLSLSYEKWDLPSHALFHRVICGGWSLMKCFATFFTPGLTGAGLVLCWAPWGVSAHFQKCCWLLSEDGYLLNYYGLNSRASMPFQHRVQQGTQPFQCSAALLWEAAQERYRLWKGWEEGSHHISTPSSARSREAPTPPFVMEVTEWGCSGIRTFGKQWYAFACY